MTTPSPERTAPAPSSPPSREPPEPPEWLLTRIWRGARDPLAFLTDLEQRFGDIVTLRTGRTYAVFHPDYVKHVLQDNHANYRKGEKYRSVLVPLMGNGLFTSDGAFWLRQRRIAQGAFHRSHLPGFAAAILECVADFIPEWERKARGNHLVALREEITALTLRATLRMLFGVDATSQMPVLVAAVHGVHNEIHPARAFIPVHLDWIRTPGQRRFARSLQVIDEFVYRIIDQRKAATEPGSDLLGLFMAARDPETGDRMDDVQLRDELVTMLNAGHDTVTDAIVWTLTQLALHPEARARARDEVVRLAGPEWPTPESLEGMEYLGRVFRETLRLCPPAWGFGRTAIGDDVIGGYAIPAGSTVLLSPWVVHRSPRFWNEPLRFDPDRFLPEAAAARAKMAYFPFGAGPRMCIGANLASMEAPLILAAILQRFDFEIPDGTPLAFSPRISLRPARTVPLRLRLLDRS
jgi:cytochrome P450